MKRRLLKLMPIDSVQSAGAQLAETQFFGSSLTQEESARQIKQLALKDTQMLFIYTGGNRDFSSVVQFKEMFGLTPNESLQVEYYPTAEHTFPLAESRRKLIQRILDFSLQFPNVPPYTREFSMDAQSHWHQSGKRAKNTS